MDINVFKELRLAADMSQHDLACKLTKYMKINKKQLEKQYIEGALSKKSITQADISERESDNDEIRLKKSLCLYIIAGQYFSVTVDDIVMNSMSESVKSAIRLLKHNSAKLPPELECKGKYLKFLIKNIENGVAGEEWVFEREVKRHIISETGLENNIIPYYRTDDTKGYDILSYNLEGKPLYIEVKSTPYASGAKARISRNEIYKARQITQDGGIYIIARVFNLGNSEKIQCKDIIFDNEFEKCLEPILYEF